MKLADLKRLPVGTRVRLVRSLLGPQPEGKQLREVVEVKPTKIAFKRIDTMDDNPTWSWLEFPTAENFRADDNGFSILEDDHKRPGRKEVACQYVFENDPAKSWDGPLLDRDERGLFVIGMEEKLAKTPCNHHNDKPLTWQWAAENNISRDIMLRFFEWTGWRCDCDCILVRVTKEEIEE